MAQPGFRFRFVWSLSLRCSSRLRRKIPRLPRPTGPMMGPAHLCDFVTYLVSLTQFSSYVGCFVVDLISSVLPTSSSSAWITRALFLWPPPSCPSFCASSSVESLWFHTVSSNLQNLQFPFFCPIFVSSVVLAQLYNLPIFPMYFYLSPQLEYKFYQGKSYLHNGFMVKGMKECMLEVLTCDDP